MMFALVFLTTILGLATTAEGGGGEFVLVREEDGNIIMEMEYTMNVDTDDLTLTVHMQEGVWSAVGFGETMVGSNAVVCSGGVVEAYFLGGQFVGGVVPTDTIELTGAEASTNNGVTTWFFTRKMKAMTEDDVDVDATGNNRMIFAYGLDDTFPGLHSFSARAQVNINFDAGTMEWLSSDLSVIDGIPEEVVAVPGCPLSLSWELGDTEVTFTAQVSGNKWLAIAVADEGVMVGGDAVIGLPSDQENAVAEYLLDGYSASDVKLQENQADLSEYQIAYNDLTKITEMKWTRKLLPDDSSSKVINSLGKTTFLWAYGESDSLAYHGSNRGVTEITLESNNCEEGSVVVSVLKQLHGVFMVVGWGVLIPIAVIICRYHKVKSGQPSKLNWFKWHRGLAMAGSLMGIIGFIIAQVMIKGEDTTKHGQLGYTTVGFGIIQVGITFARGSKDDHKRMTDKRVIFETIHKILGRCTAAIVAPLTILLGLNEIDPDGTSMVGGIVWFVILFAYASYRQTFVKIVTTYEAVFGRKNVDDMKSVVPITGYLKVLSAPAQAPDKCVVGSNLAIDMMGESTYGRSSTCTYQISPNNSSLSKEHFAIRYDEQRKYQVKVLGKMGILLNKEKKVADEETWHDLAYGDLISFGDCPDETGMYEYMYELVDPSDAEAAKQREYRGFLVIVETSDDSDCPSHAMVGCGFEVLHSGVVCTVGRSSSECMHQMCSSNADGVSKHQFSIRYIPVSKSWRVQDASKNGTYLNGKRLKDGWYALAEGSIIGVCKKGTTEDGNPDFTYSLKFERRIPELPKNGKKEEL